MNSNTEENLIPDRQLDMENEGGDFDFYKGNNYDEYDQVYEALPDDDSGIPDMLAELKRNFRTGVT